MVSLLATEVEEYWEEEGLEEEGMEEENSTLSTSFASLKTNL